MLLCFILTALVECKNTKLIFSYFFLANRTVIYLDHLSSWYDFKTHKKLLDMNIMCKINECIEPAGLVGLDKLYSHMIKSDLESLVNSLQRSVSNDKTLAELVNTVSEQAASMCPSLAQPTKLYSNYVTKFTKSVPKILDLVLAIGQKQIIRKYIAAELNTSCKFNSKNLESSLRTMNEYALKCLFKFKIVFD